VGKEKGKVVEDNETKVRKELHCGKGGFSVSFMSEKGSGLVVSEN
jgi:hypothetical protein